METGSATLPDDSIAEFLRLLPAASLATARCVCKAWRNIIDGHELLLPHILPHNVHGIFINYSNHRRPHLFASSSSSSTSSDVDGMLGFMPNEQRDWWSVMDRCNGLLLCCINMDADLCVCNPATRQCTLLPRQRKRMWSDEPPHDAYAYLVFDPQVSPHFEVFLVPSVPEKPPPPDRWCKEERDRRALLLQQELEAPFCLDWFFSSPDDELVAEEIDDDLEEMPPVDEDDMESVDDPCLLMEWPPSQRVVNVFSLRTGRWEERTFVREGDPAGIVKEMRLDPPSPTWLGPRWRYAVYWHGALYVHCQGGFIARLQVSGDKYQAIKTPANTHSGKPYLGRTDVCFGIVHSLLRVWILSESHGRMEWVLKHQHDLLPHAQYISSCYNNGKHAKGPWTVIQEHNDDLYDSDDISETASSENFEWNSNNTDILSVEVGDSDNSTKETLGELNFDWLSVDDEDGDEEYYSSRTFDILGFHPHEDVVFLVEPFGAAAYDLNSSKIQYLGDSKPKSYDQTPSHGIFESFVYTPCMIGELHKGNLGLITHS
nr:unnamed protein product [Digitaria exilis]